ncbi:hypothetical protein Q7P37_002846 [Cladosporium fusiforme]
MKTATAAHAQVDDEEHESITPNTAYAPVYDGSAPSTKRASTRKCTAVRNTEDNWLFEVICVVVGSVLLVSLYLVLQMYDGKPTPQFGSAFGSSLTLNTIVAIIAAAAKLLLLLPVAECVGQLRWIWFSRGHRQLNDFATFDRAARGSIWSGFELLWTTRMRSLASMGAFITLFAVAIDPLSQQLIAYRTESRVVSNNTTVPVAARYAELSTNVQAVTITGQDYDDLVDLGGSPPDYAYSSAGMKSAIRSGLGNGNDRVLEIPAICPGGNCTFDAYPSLAVCSSFADVTEHLHRTNVSTDALNFPFELQLHVTDDHYLVELDGFSQAMFNVSSVATSFEDSNLSGSGNPVEFLNFSQSLAFKDIKAPLANVFLITKNGTVPAGPEGSPMVNLTHAAFEIALSWCVQTYDTEVVNGTSLTRKLDANHNFTGLHELSNNVSGEEWTIDGKHHASLQWFLKQLFSGSGRQQGTENTATSDVAQVLFEPFDGLGYEKPKGKLSQGLNATEREGLQLIFDNVATSMTNYVRRSTRGAVEPSFLPNSATGSVWSGVTVVHIRWPWIAAHACFALFSAGLLVATVWCHRMSPMRGQEPWKSSGVAILHALDPALQREMLGIAKMSELQGRGEGRMVRLEDGDEGWRLVAMSKEEHDGEGEGESASVHA